MTCTVLVQQPTDCERISSHSSVSKPNNIEIPQIESGGKDENDLEERNELDEKEIIDKEDHENGDDDFPNVEEV